MPVICYSLLSDFQGQPFPGSRALPMLADDLEEMKIVFRCGRKTTVNLHLDANGNRVT
jgi:thymidine kinase